ncbi:hypothetical protein ACCO45_008061 [Purpureocillium lilacinum]|uniref:Uncharacterized protein n=1 Tax=Purpureocillium lilacinum TaxID=33203 RepID=A0ACC4DNA3_PURLI
MHPEGEEMMDRRRYDRSPKGFTYEFRDVDLTNGIDQGWKPFSMTTPILLSLALLSLLVAAGIETLA